MHLQLTEALRDLVLSFARELVSDPLERDLFGVQIVRPLGGPSTPLSLPGAPTPLAGTAFRAPRTRTLNRPPLAVPGGEWDRAALRRSAA